MSGSYSRSWSKRRCWLQPWRASGHRGPGCQAPLWLRLQASPSLTARPCSSAPPCTWQLCLGTSRWHRSCWSRLPAASAPAMLRCVQLSSDMGPSLASACLFILSCLAEAALVLRYCRPRISMRLFLSIFVEEEWLRRGQQRCTSQLGRAGRSLCRCWRWCLSATWTHATTAAAQQCTLPLPWAEPTWSTSSGAPAARLSLWIQTDGAVCPFCLSRGSPIHD